MVIKIYTVEIYDPLRQCSTIRSWLAVRVLTSARKQEREEEWKRRHDNKQHRSQKATVSALAPQKVLKLSISLTFLWKMEIARSGVKYGKLGTFDVVNCNFC
jgi:hypothetical protein